MFLPLSSLLSAGPSPSFPFSLFPVLPFVPFFGVYPLLLRFLLYPPFYHVHSPLFVLVRAATDSFASCPRSCGPARGEARAGGSGLPLIRRTNRRCFRQPRETRQARKA